MRQNKQRNTKTTKRQKPSQSNQVRSKRVQRPYWSAQQRESINNVRGDGLPDMLMTTLQYSDQIILTASAGYAAYVLRGNSLYDPDYTSVGTQPNEFVQLSTLYSKYRVIRSHIHVYVTNGSGTVSTQVIVVPTTEPLTNGSPRQQVQSLPRAKTTGLTSLGGALPREVRHEISTRTQLGLMKYQDRDEDYAALVTQNPVAIWYWNLFAFNQSLTNLNDVITFKLAYKCVFYDKVVASPSFSDAILVQKQISAQKKEIQRQEKISIWESISKEQMFKLSGLDYPAHSSERVGVDPVPYSMPVTVMNSTLSTNVTNTSLNVKVLPFVRDNQ